MTLPRHRLGKRHMELMTIICQERHGHAPPSAEHRDLERWGYINIFHQPAGGFEYVPTQDGRNTERTWREMREPG